MLAYLYLTISFCMAVASFFMYHHRHRALIRGLGILLAYIAAGIALKVYYMTSP